METHYAKLGPMADRGPTGTKVVNPRHMRALRLVALDIDVRGVKRHGVLPRLPLTKVDQRRLHIRVDLLHLLHLLRSRLRGAVGRTRPLLLPLAVLGVGLLFLRFGLGLGLGLGLGFRRLRFRLGFEVASNSMLRAMAMHTELPSRLWVKDEGLVIGHQVVESHFLQRGGNLLVSFPLAVIILDLAPPLGELGTQAFGRLEELGRKACLVLLEVFVTRAAQLSQEVGEEYLRALLDHWRRVRLGEDRYAQRRHGRATARAKVHYIGRHDITELLTGAERGEGWLFDNLGEQRKGRRGLQVRLGLPSHEDQQRRRVLLSRRRRREAHEVAARRQVDHTNLWIHGFGDRVGAVGH
mmetsp:Transcript_85290/g.241629  ORF Transcript_85290/g.241629 Transcript_85290/m.241629 type:complete len:353 (-) Transcript_85290:740-1798(-)